MIIRETEAGWRCIAQIDHARAAGLMAHMWGNGQFVRSPYHHALTLATTVHDQGWVMIDAMLPLHGDGAPLNFRGMPSDYTIPIWRAAVQAASEIDPYTAILIGRHAQLIYNLSSVAENMEDSELAGMREWLAETEADLLSQAQELPHYHELTTERIARDYRILRICDLLSLAICTGDMPEGTIDTVPVNDDDMTTLKYAITDPHTLTVSPFPFKAPMTVSIPYVDLTQKHFDSTQALQTAYFSAPRAALNVQVIDGS